MAGETKISRINIDELIEYIYEGKTYREMANIFDVKLSTLSDFIAKTEHSARVKEALRISADTYADKAEQVLKDAPSNLVEIQRARELAQYYKWKSSKRAPQTYGEKIDVVSEGKAIPAPQIIMMPFKPE